MSLDKDSWEAGVATGMTGPETRFRIVDDPGVEPEPDRIPGPMLVSALIGAALGGCLVSLIWAITEAVR